FSVGPVIAHPSGPTATLGVTARVTRHGARPPLYPGPMWETVAVLGVLPASSGRSLARSAPTRVLATVLALLAALLASGALLLLTSTPAQAHENTLTSSEP